MSIAIGAMFATESFGAQSLQTMHKNGIAIRVLLLKESRLRSVGLGLITWCEHIHEETFEFLTCTGTVFWQWFEMCVEPKMCAFQ